MMSRHLEKHRGFGTACTISVNSLDAMKHILKILFNQMVPLIPQKKLASVELNSMTDHHYKNVDPELMSIIDCFTDGSL